MSCVGVTRKQINADLWEQSGIPKELCEKYPELQEYGHYRVLNNGKYQRFSYCNEELDKSGKMVNSSQLMNSMKKSIVKEILDATLPEEK